MNRATPAPEKVAEEIMSGLHIVYDKQFTGFHNAVIYS
jgi:hypothetical protein